MGQASEKRSSIRKDFALPVGVGFSCVAGGRIINVRKNGTGVDISSGGIQITVDHKLPRGTVVKLYMPLDAVNTSFPVYSEVVWSKSETDYFRIGLRFLS